MKEKVLRNRIQRELNSIYYDYLEEESLKKYDEVKESDPYLNQVIDDVLDYVVYELPLEEYLVKKLRGE